MNIRRFKEILREGDLGYALMQRIFRNMQEKRAFTHKYKFIDRQKGTAKLIILLAGFQSYYWDMCAKNLDNANYDNSDVCICIPKGLNNSSNEKLFEIAELYKWSVCYIPHDKLAQVQNVAIKLHPNAEVIYKLDEDIMFPINYFRVMDAAREKIISEGIYNPGMVVPIININIATYLDYIKVMHIDNPWFFSIQNELDKFHKSIDSALILTQSVVAGGGINGCAKLFEKNNEGQYRAIATRFSIGALSFTRKTWEDMGYFLVGRVGDMGVEEEQMCAYCVNESKPCVCATDCLAIHLGYFTSKEACREYFEKHSHYFDNTVGE